MQSYKNNYYYSPICNQFIGNVLIYLKKIDSTNNFALEMLKTENVDNGTVIITNNQTKGRGQFNNKWESDVNKNLTFSVVVFPDFLSLKEIFYTTIIASLSIYDMIRKYIPNDISIKWPNDIYYKNRKIGGVLIENAIQKQKISHCIIGIGLNVNQTKFDDKKAISISNILGCEKDRAEILSNLLESLEKKYIQVQNGNKDKLMFEYLQHLYGRGELLSFDTPNGKIKGVILGVDKVTGKLQVNVNNKIESFGLKEITFSENI